MLSYNAHEALRVRAADAAAPHLSPALLLAFTLAPSCSSSSQLHARKGGGREQKATLEVNRWHFGLPLRCRLLAAQYRAMPAAAKE